MAQKEKARSMTVRISDNTDRKFGIIWNILQSYEPPQTRLSRNDVFETIVRDYYQIVNDRAKISNDL
jgi:lipopolysaccharide biosynthesis protein